MLIFKRKRGRKFAMLLILLLVFLVSVYRMDLAKKESTIRTICP